MSSFHVNPETGNAGVCRAESGNCPFGSTDDHYPSADLARAAYERSSLAPEESAETWPPIGLPKKLFTVASTSDLIRHYNDEVFLGGAGVCLGSSAFVSNRLIEAGIPHKLVRGEYTDATGEAKAHWWVESGSWILDSSRGQFEEKEYRSGVIRAGHPSYSKSEEFEPGHTSEALVIAELKRCFANPAEADYYYDMLLNFEDDAKSL